jgi:methylmalonyl-CoA mutase
MQPGRGGAQVDAHAGEPLAAGFEPASLEAWRALAARALEAGRTIESLTVQDEDGIAIAPLYTAADARLDAPRPWRSAAAWTICPLIDHAEPGEASRQAVEELEGGAGAILLDLGPHGVRVEGASDLRAALDGVRLEMAGLVLDPGPRWAEVAVWQTEIRPADALPVALGADPLAHGQAPDGLARLAQPGLIVAAADGRVWHERGATVVQEIAAVLATGVAYLRALDGEAGQIALIVAVDADVFAGIAKLRALRRCWARVLAACGVTAPVRIHAHTSRRMLTRRDPETNLLRHTQACFAAGIGGADLVTVLPHDHAIRRASRLARRIARNIGHVLIEEAGLARVADPAGGSWYLEARTDATARAAWALFQAIEASGGIGSGLLAEKVAAAAEARAAAIASGERVIVGTTRFRRPGEAEPLDRGLPVRRDAAAAEAGP